MYRECSCLKQVVIYRGVHNQSSVHGMANYGNIILDTIKCKCDKLLSFFVIIFYFFDNKKKQNKTTKYSVRNLWPWLDIPLKKI